MSVCPFCKKTTADPHGPCPSCGRTAADHPSVQGMQGGTINGGWGEADLGPELELSPTAGHQAGPAQSAYAGGGMSLGDDDDPFADDAEEGALELDLPSAHTANGSRSLGSGNAGDLAPPPDAGPDLEAPPMSQRLPSGQMQAQRPSVGGMKAVQAEPEPQASAPPQAAAPPAAPAFVPAPPDPASIIARFPASPAKVWEAPAYMFKVAVRQFELRQDLASLRKRRSPDVPLYEQALKAHDAKAFALGLAIACAGFAILSFIFFLPVILRFVSAGP